MKIHHRKQAFGRIAKDYQKYRWSYPAFTYKELFTLLNKKGPINILDIGCGTGKSTESLIKAAPRSIRTRIIVTGCDPDRAMLNEARLSAKKNKLPITYVEGKAEDLPFPPASFDAVISGAAFHWFATVKALKSINRKLKPGGALYVFWFEGRKRRPNGPRMISGEILKKYRLVGIPKRAMNDDKNKILFEKAGFLKFGTAAMPFETKRTIDEVIGLYKTQSTFILMSQDKQRGFVRDMREAFAKSLGKRNYIISRRQVHVNYGIKK
jgi:ubiquinone/menaquinone biosynthesis C-methylase UbiE